MSEHRNFAQAGGSQMLSVFNVFGHVLQRRVEPVSQARNTTYACSTLLLSTNVSVLDDTLEGKLTLN